MTEHRPLESGPLRVRLRVEDYLLLDQAGAFDSYAKTELIDGRIIGMNAQHRPHALVKIRLYDRLRDALQAMGSPLLAMIEAGTTLSNENLVEPDLVLTSEPEGTGFIPLHTVALILEVADTSLVFDLGEKAALYARHGVPEYWVADVQAQVIHQMWLPEGDTYTHRREVPFGEQLASATVADLRILA